MKKLFLIIFFLLFSTTCFGWSSNDYTDEEKAIVADALTKTVYDIDGNGVVDSVDTGAGYVETSDTIAWDKNASDDFDGRYTSLSDIPLAFIPETHGNEAHTDAYITAGDIPAETDPNFAAWLLATPPAYPDDIPSIAGLLDETAHDLLDHTGLTGIPTEYTDEKAQDAIGATVDTDASTGDIAFSYDDATPEISGRVRKAVNAKGTVSTDQTFNLTSYGSITMTVGAAISVDLTGTYTASKLYTAELVITNGGAYTITWPAKFKFVGGAAPTLTASGRDTLTLITRDGGATCDVFVNGKDVK